MKKNYRKNTKSSDYVDGARPFFVLYFLLNPIHKCAMVNEICHVIQEDTRDLN